VLTFPTFGKLSDGKSEERNDMSDLDEHDLIDRVTRQAQIVGYALGGGGLIVALIVGALRHPQGGGEVPNWLVVAVVAVSLTLSVFPSRLTVVRGRRRIAAGTWYSLSRRWVDENGRLNEHLRHPAIRSDRGQLAYIWWLQILIGVGLVHGPLVIFAFNAHKITSPIKLAACALLAGAYIAQFPTRTRVTNWIDRQEVLVLRERQVTASRSTRPGTGQLLRKPRNKPRRRDVASGVEDQVCSWLTEGAGGNDLDRRRESPDRHTHAVGPQQQPQGADRVAESTTDARIPADDPPDSSDSILKGLREIFAPEPGLRPWEKVRDSLALALIVNLFVGVFVGARLYVKDSRLAGWEVWLFAAPFILLGIIALAAFVGRLILAIKYTWDEKSSRSRRTRRSRGNPVRN
jgi:hypothetical protein